MTTTSRAKRFFFFFSSKHTFQRVRSLSLRLQILPFRIAGVPCAMRAVAFSTMQGPLSRTHSTVPLARGAPSSLSPLRRRHTIRRHVDHHQRRLLTPPSHASAPFSKEQQQQQQQQQQHGEEGSTEAEEAEEAAEAVAKAVRKGVVSVIFLIAWLGASSLKRFKTSLNPPPGKKKKKTVPRRPLRLARALVPRRARVRDAQGQAHGGQAARKGPRPLARRRRLALLRGQVPTPRRAAERGARGDGGRGRRRSRRARGEEDGGEESAQGAAVRVSCCGFGFGFGLLPFLSFLPDLSLFSFRHLSCSDRREK